jgi:hypothetical protein
MPTPTWTIQLEGGPIWQSYNDVEIPNDGSATRFSLFDLAGNRTGMALSRASSTRRRSMADSRCA